MLILLKMTTTTEIILAMCKILYSSLFLPLLVAALITVLEGIRHPGNLLFYCFFNLFIRKVSNKWGKVATKSICHVANAGNSCISPLRVVPLLTHNTFFLFSPTSGLFTQIPAVPQLLGNSGEIMGNCLRGYIVHTSLDKYPGSFKEGVNNHHVCVSLDECYFTQNQPTEEETW